MPCLFAIIALLFPRVLIVILWLLTDWFTGVFDSLLWPILGFIFLPITTLWYSAVINWYGGQWSGMNIIIMVLAVILDMGSAGSGYRRKRSGS